MRIVWMSWKDGYHPQTGGAEIVSGALMRRLVQDGHSVTLITSSYPGAAHETWHSGLRIIRVGSNRYIHPISGLAYYMRHLRTECDMLIEEVNVAPYFSAVLSQKIKSYLFYHQLEGPVWPYEVPKPLGYIGKYILEPTATRILSRSKIPVLTISDSTAKDLVSYGFPPSQIAIISEGINLQPVPSLAAIVKFEKPTLLCFGAMRTMKRTIDQITAFEILKSVLPDAQLKIAGRCDSRYGQRVMAQIHASPYRSDIEYFGHVDTRQKMHLFRRCHIVMQTAVHEGWGLTVTEAASQGTPAVGYNVKGLRDSIKHNVTGILTHQNPRALASAMVGLLKNKPQYQALQQAAWQWSKTITFEQSYQDFTHATGLDKAGGNTYA